MEEICRKCKMVQMVFFLCSLLPLVMGYSAGPPQTSCGDLGVGVEQGAFGFELEGHSSMPQNIIHKGHKSMFHIQVHPPNATYVRGDDITVSVVANQTTGQAKYTGLMMQVRNVECATPDRSIILVEDEPLGRFYALGTQKDALLQPMTCFDEEDNTLAHVTPQWKTKESATWRVPEELEGHVVFRATIVQDGMAYWTEQHSMILQDPDLGDVPRCTAVSAHTTGLLITVITLTATLLHKFLQV